MAVFVRTEIIHITHYYDASSSLQQTLAVRFKFAGRLLDAVPEENFIPRLVLLLRL